MYRFVGALRTRPSPDIWAALLDDVRVMVDEMADNVKETRKLATVKDEEVEETSAEDERDSEEGEDANERRKKEVKEMVEGLSVFETSNSSGDEEPDVKRSRLDKETQEVRAEEEPHVRAEEELNIMAEEEFNVRAEEELNIRAEEESNVRAEEEPTVGVIRFTSFCHS